MRRDSKNVFWQKLVNSFDFSSFANCREDSVEVPDVTFQSKYFDFCKF